jgi:hypothetical protein
MDKLIIKELYELPSYGMWRHVGLLTANISDELVTSTFRWKKTSELETTLAVC